MSDPVIIYKSVVTPLPYCDAVSRCDETKTIKPIINEAFVAFSGDIITDYNDLYCLFTHRVASRRVNITMSAFVIGETTNNKHYSTLLKTCIWIVSSKLFKYENILTGCESEALDCPCKVGIAPLYSVHSYSPRFRKQSSVKCAAHTLKFGLNCSGTVL